MPTPSRMAIAVEISPLAVLVRGGLEWACHGAFPDDLFDRQWLPKQRSRTLGISAVPWLMFTVLSGDRRSVFAAFRADRDGGAPRS